MIGLIGLLLSSSLPVSEPFAPILVSGIISWVFVAAVAGYLLWIVVHGLVYTDVSPFRPTILKAIAQSCYERGIRPRTGYCSNDWALLPECRCLLRATPQLSVGPHTSSACYLRCHIRPLTSSTSKNTSVRTIYLCMLFQKSGRAGRIEVHVPGLVERR